MRLPPLRQRPYDPEICEGSIGILVAIHAGGESIKCETGGGAGECIGGAAVLSADEQHARAEAIMREAGAVRIIGEELP
jgi:hypothetical protein